MYTIHPLRYHNAYRAGIRKLHVLVSDLSPLLLPVQPLRVFGFLDLIHLELLPVFTITPLLSTTPAAANTAGDTQA